MLFNSSGNTNTKFFVKAIQFIIHCGNKCSRSALEERVAVSNNVKKDPASSCCGVFCFLVYQYYSLQSYQSTSSFQGKSCFLLGCCEKLVCNLVPLKYVNSNFFHSVKAKCKVKHMSMAHAHVLQSAT